MEINKVGVMGAGTMGGGIAQVVAQAGFQVALLDLSEALVKGGVEKVEKILLKSVERGKLPLQEKEKIQSETGIKNTEFSAERLILRQVNEAAYCLQEKIATAEDIDRALVLGTGFPCDEKGVGGPLHWADEKGLDWVLGTLNHLKDTLGARFWPHFLLKQYVAAGCLGKKKKKGFFDY